MASTKNADHLKKYKRKKRKRIKRSTVILLLLMLTYLAYHYISLEIRHQSLIQQRDQLKTNIQETENHQGYLLKQVENSKTNEYIEKLARKYLGLVYPDEKVFIEKEIGGPD